MTTIVIPGWGPEEPATPEIQNICDQIKSDFENKVGKNFEAFTAKRFIIRPLCGATHYIIKVYLGEENYVHVKVIHPVLEKPEKPELRGYQCPETEQDPIIPFECC